MSRDTEMNGFGVVNGAWLITVVVLVVQAVVIGILAVSGLYSHAEMLLASLLLAAVAEILMPLKFSADNFLALLGAVFLTFIVAKIAVSMEILLLFASILLACVAACVAWKLTAKKDFSTVLFVLLVPLIIDWLVAVARFF